MAPSVALVAVATSGLYMDFADVLMASAEKHFHPSDDITLRIIPGEEGWPRATMCRHRRVLEEMPNTDYVFLVDCDMLFVADAGPSILPEEGIVCTQHPGYVGKPAHELPFETREESRCYVPMEKRSLYVCGGFVGGTRYAYEWFARAIMAKLDADAADGIVPVHHDESALNAVLVGYGGSPDILLTPSFCCPADSQWYRSWWPRDYKPILLALDKTPEQRASRDQVTHA